MHEIRFIGELEMKDPLPREQQYIAVSTKDECALLKFSLRTEQTAQNGKLFLLFIYLINLSIRDISSILRFLKRYPKTIG